MWKAKLLPHQHVPLNNHQNALKQKSNVGDAKLWNAAAKNSKNPNSKNEIDRQTKMISPGLIVMVGLVVYAPIIVLIITALVAFKRLTQQNLFQRYDWYWIKLTGVKNIILYAITVVGIIVAAIVVWRVLQVWQLRPTNSGDWLSYMGQYATYTGVSVLYALIATTLWLPAFMV